MDRDAVLTWRVRGKSLWSLAVFFIIPASMYFALAMLSEATTLARIFPRVEQMDTRMEEIIYITGDQCESLIGGGGS